MTAYSLHPGIINTELGRYMMDHMQAEADAQGWLAQQLSKAFASFWCARACVCVRACTHVLVCVYVCAHERVCVCVCVRVGICYIPLLLPHTFSGHGGYEQALVLLRFAGFLDKPTIVKNLDGKEVLVNQVGCYGINLGRIDFYFDNSKSKTADGKSIVV